MTSWPSCTIQNQPCSFKQFKAYIKSQGICLANCCAYGSQAALKTQLQEHRNLVVHKEEAKGLKYVKQCLVVVG